MPFPLRPLEWKDISQDKPSVQMLDEFKKIADFAIAAGARVLEVTSEGKQWVGLLENVHWRAEDFYFPMIQGKKLTPCDVYHPTIHFLFVRKYGHELADRPLSLLLGEALASMSEYYFVLQAMQKHGFGGEHEVGFLSTCAEFEKRRMGVDQQTAEMALMRFLVSEHTDPWAAYQRAVQELFTFLRQLFEAGAMRAEGQTTDFATFTKRCEKLRYGTLVLRYHVGLNVADALAFCGKDPSERDYEAIQECLTLLRGAKSMLEFLDSLGMQAQSAKKAA